MADQETIECRKCRGRGYVYLPKDPRRKTVIPRRQPCAVCKGSGRIPVEPAAASGGA